MDKELMKHAIEEACKNKKNNFKDGGPFGAIVVKDGKIIGKGHNTVLKSNDPTAHAEVNAIRDAAKNLHTHDLSGCVIYVNSEPCPMCLSAIIWANIKSVYFVNTKEDAEEIGFRDDMIYDFIKNDNKDTRILKMTRLEDEEAKKTFQEFKENEEKTLY